MQKHIKARRTQYKSHLQRIKHTIDNRDTRNAISRRIHIPIRYDGYARTEYVKIVYGKTRDTRAQRYVNITNIINDIFPEINAPHNAHTYRGTAPYRKYPQKDNTLEGIYERAYEWWRQTMDTATPTIYKDTRTVKCIIMNDDEEIIYIGKIRRTRVVNVTRGTIDITLHRNKRTMIAHERAVDLDRIIHGLTIKEIKAHDVEIYYI